MKSPRSALSFRLICSGLLLTLALGSGVADAARRSGGGFGGSRSSSGSTYRAPTPQYRAPTPQYRAPTPQYRAPQNTAPQYRAPAPAQRTPAPTQRSTTATPARTPNTAAVPNVSATQLNGWKSVKLPAGVPRTAITYSTAKNSQYQYQLQNGRYYPYPQSYYRSRGIGADIFKYALIYTAVSSLTNAGATNVVVNNVQPGGELSGLTYDTPVNITQPAGPSIWTYVFVGFLAAAAGWFMFGRRKR
ncbi:hypothetical protein E7T06_12290 [Deinococcus sp. Arct2-2]|uniref:hypothetical protein n=1 Tax=Deinococcus sp. Arct2-2 TaxID=2568653 RepID=UPI0010A420CA|nr:hypothetical protein [Deinococcus sp. Arct2-2]THF69364.1 hypothetical protein E7T06_12290 [Deinococcus sp. Arct2-2]